jgi:UDP-N-acetyl-D-galactosamine dehydrogenase
MQPTGLLNKTVAVVGLGYVGLPLALAFGRKMRTIGFDVAIDKIAAYQTGVDPAGEVGPDDFLTASRLAFTTAPASLREADFVVVAVPTPIDNAKVPDLSPVIGATRTVGQNLKRGATVVFESTVYPGVTEDICGPLLEQESGLRAHSDFKLGYSPERINPGDKVNRLETIVKVVSGEDADTLAQVAALYELVIDAGVHRASSIKVAEAAKIIENTQRDVNIALINEFAIICDLMDIDTHEVLRAAETKWNFLRFTPGLVGGHCIGVDPYYLTHKTQSLGFSPEVILAARRINDRMGAFVAHAAVREALRAGRIGLGARMLLLGMTFKENCADIRNSKVADIVTELASLGIAVEVWDPVASAVDVRHEYGIALAADWRGHGDVAAVIAAVAHDAVRCISAAELVREYGHGLPIIDVKAIYEPAQAEAGGARLWRL